MGITSKRINAIWLKFQCHELGISCQYCEHWKQHTEKTGKCKNLKISTEATFYCTNWYESDTATKLP